MGHDYSLDVTNLDPVPMKFDHPVRTADNLELTGGDETGQIPCAEEDASIERVWHESRLGKLGSIAVSVADTASANVNLAALSRLYWRQILVEEVDAAIDHWPTNTDRTITGCNEPYASVGSFRRSVYIPYLS